MMGSHVVKHLAPWTCDYMITL